MTLGGSCKTGCSCVSAPEDTSGEQLKICIKSGQSPILNLSGRVTVEEWQPVTQLLGLGGLSCCMDFGQWQVVKSYLDSKESHI